MMFYVKKPFRFVKYRIILKLFRFVKYRIILKLFRFVKNIFLNLNPYFNLNFLESNNMIFDENLKNHLLFYFKPILKKIKYIYMHPKIQKNFQQYSLQDKKYSKLEFELLKKVKIENHNSIFPTINLHSGNFNDLNLSYNFDTVNSKSATSEMLNLGSLVLANKSKLNFYKKKYNKEIHKNKKNKKILLLGSGPNVEKLNLSDFKEFDILICNSLIKSKEISKLNNVKYIVFADPIFHAGPSKYAQKFRNKLEENYKDKDVKIITVLRDLHIYKEYIDKEIFKKMFFVEITSQDNFNYSLNSNFSVKATNNILTLLMLPLAMNNYKEIYFAGFDGNSDEKKTYFWKHSTKYQFNNELDEIKTEHPGFFRVEYQEYNDIHSTILESIIVNNNKNFLFKNLTDSHINVLKDIS